MTGMSATLAELLMDCDAIGIRLAPASDGTITIDAPRSALTPAFVSRLKAHKAQLLTLLLRTKDVDVGSAPHSKPVHNSAPTTTTKAICRCGSSTWRDVAIHDGQSTRRDCGRCGRFIEFPIWYGNNTGHNDQHSIECSHGRETRQTTDGPT